MHRSLGELVDGLPLIRMSPSAQGVLRAIVIRPAPGERISLAVCDLSPERGVHGDRWADVLHGGTPHPDVQISITNARAIDLIAGTRSRWPLAGDNLYVDMDLSSENLPSGQRLSIGSAVIEVTDVAHNGCKKFGRRFGTDAVRFVNSEVGKLLHLRGIYARVVTAGVIRVGDEILKLQPVKR